MLYHECSIRWRLEFLFPRPMKVHQGPDSRGAAYVLSALSTKPMENEDTLCLFWNVFVRTESMQHSNLQTLDRYLLIRTEAIPLALLTWKHVCLGERLWSSSSGRWHRWQRCCRERTKPRNQAGLRAALEVRAKPPGVTLVGAAGRTRDLASWSYLQIYIK